MNLPRKILLAFLLSAVVFTLCVAGAFAFSRQYPDQRFVNTPTSPQATSNAIASDTQGQVLGCSVWNPGSWGSCVQDAGEKLIDWGVYIVQNVFFRQATGCNHEDTGCQENALREIRDGVPVAEMESPGALMLVATSLDGITTMPVPIDSKTYFASINPFKQVEAQSGVDDLAKNEGLLKFWQMMRNASYALMVVVLIILGFMIMFRIPINPRTVVTAENALPRVAVSLILITFSFAISGLLIDFGRIAMNLVGWVAAGVGVDVTVLIAKLVGGIAFSSLLSFAMFGVSAVALLLGLILVLFILVILLIIGWKMVQRFAMFIILSVFSPFVFLFATIPGGEGLVMGWFKRQLSNIMAIPAMVFMLLLAMVVVNTAMPLPTPINTVANPFGLANYIVGPLIGIGILMAATRVPEMIDDALGIREAGKGAGFTGGAVVGAAIAAKRMDITPSRAKELWRQTPMRYGWEKMRGRTPDYDRETGKLKGFIPQTIRPQPFSERGEQGASKGPTGGSGATSGTGGGGGRTGVNREPGAGPAESQAPPRTGEPPKST